ncbi:subtilase-type protease inhibitor [Salinactinospora qingdaonensis]|uniref:Subtilisin inhibitor-like n=1 Tax=Salinactinospora qingdaonensis TaxID=702744 RepID=A0ABP7EWA0_9ACTN
MHKLNSRRGAPGSTGTVVLGSLCFGAAFAYVAVVGLSLVALPEEPLATEQLSTMSGVSQFSRAPVASLSVTVDDGERTYQQTLTCSGAPERDPAACSALADSVRGERAGSPFDEVPPGAICTDTSYGPERATITGVWNGQRIDTELSRQGSCEEARWQRLTSLTRPLE